jgi:hypothetical protein
MYDHWEPSASPKRVEHTGLSGAKQRNMWTIPTTVGAADWHERCCLTPFLS